MPESQNGLHHKRNKSVDGVCKRCGSRRVVESRHRGVEAVIVSFLPCNIHRCADCYQRFWAKESLFAHSKRAWVWICAFGLIFVFLGLKVQTAVKPSGVNRTAEFIPQFDEAEPVSAVEERKPKVVSASSVLSNVSKPDVDSAVQTLAVAGYEQPTTAELNKVKISDEQVGILHQESVDRLEQAVVDDEAALESLLKVDIGYRVERWRESWESGLFDYYLDYYASDYTPNDTMSHLEWVDNRKRRVKPEKKIKIVLNEFDVTFLENKAIATVTFDQHYSSYTYSDHSRKKLVWSKQDDVWKIISETQVSN